MPDVVPPDYRPPDAATLKKIAIAAGKVHAAENILLAVEGDDDLPSPRQQVLNSLGGLPAIPGRRGITDRWLPPELLGVMLAMAAEHEIQVSKIGTDQSGQDKRVRHFAIDRIDGAPADADHPALSEVQLAAMTAGAKLTTSALQRPELTVLRVEMPEAGAIKLDVGDPYRNYKPAKPLKKKQPEPKKDEPKKDEPKKDEPKKDEPKKDEPKKDEPKKDEPKKDEPKKDEPKKDEPKKDEPSKDEPGLLEPEPYDAAPSATENVRRPVERLRALVGADESAPLPTRYWILESEGSDVAHLLESCPAVQASDAPLIGHEEDAPIEPQDTPGGLPICGQCVGMFEAAPPLWLTWERGPFTVDVWTDRVRWSESGPLGIGGTEKVLPLADLRGTGLADSGFLSAARLDLHFSDLTIEVFFDDDAQASQAFEDLLEIRPDQRPTAPPTQEESA